MSRKRENSETRVAKTSKKDEKKVKKIVERKK